MFSKKKKKDEEAPSETSGLAASGAPASGGATSSSAAPPADVEHGQGPLPPHHTTQSHGLVYNNPSVEDEDAQKEAEEVQSWHGAEPKWTPLYCKGFLASIFSLLSVYVAFDGWATMSFTDMLVFKCLMFGLSCLLTLPQLYQTTLITLTFVSVARGAVVFELQQRRPPYVVLGVAFVLMFLLPFILPLLLIGGCLFAPLLERFGIKDFWLVIVGLIDFIQTLVLIPLAFVVIFSAGSPTDIFIDIVAVQVFANLDDEFVRAFSEPQAVKRDALETYCEKIKPK